MLKRITFSILIMMIVFSVSIFVGAQKSISDILYGDFSEIETFGYIYVKVQGDRAVMMGLNENTIPTATPAKEA